MKNDKFIVACLEVVEDKEELDFIWKQTSYRETDDDYRMKTSLLKKAMGEAKYFDVPSEAAAEYYCIEAMFLSFQWKDANNLQRIKDLVNKYI